ncbi:3'-5' exonuclease [Enterobacter asburiae]|uniref:3'-5' exonuclease n=1 Tax=Enterobacter asburiae TaxID=61645 RepID=UPI003F5722BA
MQHIMIDLETMDEPPAAAIVAIAAVAFDPEEGVIGKQFYQRVNLESSVRHGGTIGAETVKWWMRQPAEARSEIVSDDAVDIKRAIGELGCFILRNSQHPDAILWARRTDFDIPIITSAMERIDITPTWKFWNVRDVRTLEHAAIAAGMDPRTSVTFEGQRHHAMNDAIHQAKIVIHIWQTLIKPHQQEHLP